MNAKCEDCKGRGIIQRDGKLTRSGKPYDLLCPQCSGVGHYRVFIPSAASLRADLAA